MPKASAGITSAGKDDLETVENLHLKLGESSFNVVVAKLTDGHKSTVVKIGPVELQLVDGAYQAERCGWLG